MNNDTSTSKKPRFDLFSMKNYNKQKDKQKDTQGHKRKNTQKSSFMSKHNKCPKDKVATTEKWFEERMLYQRDTRSSSVNNPKVTNPEKHMTLDKLETEILKIKHKNCQICLKENTPEFIHMERCSHQFCKECVQEYKSLYNRCPTCSKVINLDYIEEYEGGEIIIPSYTNFRYYGTDFCDFNYNWYTSVY